LQGQFHKTCSGGSELGRQLMTMRQNGTDISKLMKIADDEGNPLARKSIRQMVLDAYRQPRFQTPEMKKQAIDDFGNDAYLKCMDLLNGK
jgi:hypothetical protein